MKTTRRRFWIFFLLFLFNLIAYVDRVNMSVAGKPISQEFGLSPVALGYLFSSFLWAYVLMMLPGGRLIDRWGAHVMASVATAVWSAAQMATGLTSSFATMLLPSRPGELHPEPLTDPDLILSHHPARATVRRPPPSVACQVPPVAG